MSNFQSVDPKELSRVLKQGNTTTRSRKTSTVDTSVRTYKVWFALPLKFGECSNEGCTDPRPSRTGEEKDKTLVAEIKGRAMCRYCFLGGYGLASQS